MDSAERGEDPPRAGGPEDRLEPAPSGPERDAEGSSLADSERGEPGAATGGPRSAEEDAERALDHALIRRAQDGDEEAFADLVHRHQARAWRVARNMLPNEEDARDLAQEAFLRVFRNLERFDFQHDFTTWLYRIVTNLAIDHLRKRRPAASTAAVGEDEAELDLPDVDGERPSDGLEREETAAEVHDVLATLAPHFQSVLVLRELEGLACTDIARIVGATHVTVRWRLHRGRKLFQEEWERRRRVAEQGGDELRDGPRSARPAPGPGEGEPGAEERRRRDEPRSAPSDETPSNSARRRP